LGRKSSLGRHKPNLFEDRRDRAAIIVTSLWRLELTGSRRAPVLRARRRPGGHLGAGRTSWNIPKACWSEKLDNPSPYTPQLDRANIKEKWGPNAKDPPSPESWLRNCGRPVLQLIAQGAGHVVEDIKIIGQVDHRFPAPRSKRRIHMLKHARDHAIEIFITDREPW